MEKEKRDTLLLIGIITLVLICFELSGLHFGIIALICWALAFWDIKTIKIKDFEITLLTKKQSLTAHEQEKYLQCFDKLNKSIKQIWEYEHTTSLSLKYADEAYEIATLYLSDDIENFVTDIQQKIKNNFIAHRKWERARLENNSENLEKFSKEKNDLFEELKTINLRKIFRPYLKIND